MSKVTIKLSAQALDYLSADDTNMQSLSETVTSLLQANKSLNESYSYFEKYKSSPSKATIYFEDGATRTYKGTITPTYVDYYYEYGSAIANSVVLNIPAGLKETITGSLHYEYEADGYGNLSLEYQGGTINSYNIYINKKLADPLYGNISAGISGEITKTAHDQINGSITSLHTTAQKIEKSSVIEGDFLVSGSASTGVQVNGALKKLRTEFYDKSLVEVIESRTVDSSFSFSLLALQQQDYWSGDDIFNVELSSKVTQALHINTGDGNDHLTLKGGRGLLSVNAGNGDDTIRLLDSEPVIRGGAGIDTVETAFSYSIATLEDIENLTLYGSKKADAVGNSLSNVLLGNSAANVIDGNGGGDLMVGGRGNDTYVIRDINDTILESANEGTDTVKSWLSWTLTDHLETLELMGLADLNGTGNSSANKITGNSGNNVLDGMGGADILVGGAGSDTYVVDLVLKGQGSKAKLVLEDKIKEAANNGIDTLQLRGEFNLTNTTTLTLAKHLENIDASQTGKTLLNLVGNAADNLIIGNRADNILTGGAGADQLFGGEGRDTFRFNSLKDLGLGDRQDVILDFTPGEDILDLKALKGYSFIGEQAFSGLKQLRYESNGDAVILFGNATGDNQADFSIKLVGVHSVSGGDLLLA